MVILVGCNKQGYEKLQTSNAKPRWAIDLKKTFSKSIIKTMNESIIIYCTFFTQKKWILNHC